MKTQIYLILILSLIHFQSSIAQQSQTVLAKAENHLNGELDYTFEALEIVQKHVNGDEIKLGEISKDGTIDINLPLFDIKAIYDSINLYRTNFHQLFLINSCTDRDVFEKTPFDDVYSQKFDPMYIKKYGENVAILFPSTDEKIFSNNHYYRSNNYDGKNLTVGSKFYWFYMDRTIDFKDECIKTDANGTNTINADIQLKKGWNFIEEELVEIQNFSNGDYQGTKPKEIKFSQSSPYSKEVKWYLIQIMKDEKIQAAKELYELEPITKIQFEKWLPKKAGKLKRTSVEYDKALERSSSKKNNVFVVFEKGNQKIEIALLDAAKNPDDLEMVHFAFAMDENFEREDKPASDKTASAAAAKKEIHYISKEDKDNNTAQILSMYKDRIILYANGENIAAEQMWEAIKVMNISSIIE